MVEAEASALPIEGVAESVAETEESRRTLTEGVRGFFERGEMCDLHFAVGEERVGAHAVVVAASSDSFRSFMLARAGEGKEDSPLKALLKEKVPVESPAANDVADATAKAASPEKAASPQKAASPGKTVSPEKPHAPSGSPAQTPPKTENAAERDVEAAMTPPKEKPTDEATEAKVEASPDRRAEGAPEFVVEKVHSIEAMKVLLTYIYSSGAEWQYAVESNQVNSDVLRLADGFGLKHLHELAARWLTKGLTTNNVVERLATCEEFGLSLLKEKIIERLTQNPQELRMVSGSAEIMKHPRILQELLMQFAALQEKPEKTEKSSGKKTSAEKFEKQQEKEKLPPGKKPRRVASAQSGA